MNIGFVFTNFNNSSFTREVVKSLEDSPHSENHFVVIVDNKSNKKDIESLQEIEKEYSSVKVIYNQENIGYFSGLNIGIRHLRKSSLSLDCIVVGNNDLVFPADFYDRLISCHDRLDRYAVISPDLITLDGVHQNPLVRTKVSSFRKFVWGVYYSNYYLALIIRWFAKVTRTLSERKDYTSHQNRGVINLGYGACYILTPVFFQYFEELWAPTFLMYEEFFLSRQLSEKGLEIFYEPIIIVNHHDHATTDNLPSKKFWEISRKSFYVSKKYQ